MNLYTGLKVFHYKEKLDSLISGTITPPLHVRIKPTNICNHRCWYCAYRQKNLQLGQDMVEKDFIPKEKMRELVEDLVEMQVKAVTFSGGGEPFCYPYLLDTIKQLSKTSVKFASLTNGARLTGEIAEVFAHCATWVRISMDGWDDKSYTYYRSVPDGEYTKIIKNIQSFKKIGGECVLSVNYVIDNSNHNHIFEAVKNLKDSGVNNIKVCPCIVSNDVLENESYHHKFFEYAREEIDRIKFLENKDFTVFDSYHHPNGKFEKSHKWCPWMQILCVIGADLNIYPCQDKAYNSQAVIGSIKDKRFRDAWDKADFYKLNPSQNCNHHCLSNEKNKLILDYLNAGHLEFV